MKNYTDSFNFVVGIGDQDFDWFDNPFVEFNVYELNQAWTPQLSKNIMMQACTSA